jgi:hypothetical protein
MSAKGDGQAVICPEEQRIIDNLAKLVMGHRNPRGYLVVASSAISDQTNLSLELRHSRYADRLFIVFKYQRFLPK